MRIPAAEGLQKIYGRYYVVQYGDSLHSIAQRFNVTMDNLLHANDQIGGTNVIYPGEAIFIPSAPPANTNRSRGKTNARKSVRKKKK